MRFEIYKLTCMVDARVYIGVTSRTTGKRFWDHTRYARLPLPKRPLKSGKRPTPIQRALRIYGTDRFTVETIDVANSREEAWAKERYWIRTYRSNERKYGYNRTKGGDGLWKNPPPDLEEIS